jgi:hypothetical protein
VHSGIRVKVIAFTFLNNTLTYSMARLKRVYLLSVLRHEQCMLADIGPISQNGTLPLVGQAS